ncbi:hypothetical protein [Cryptosporangium sp. NPDC048952]|uniref:hypothetical protein n=1 Tax=Cryptosporangium sp. NPDC048952 TaxID=3363961 RepID=UPI00371C5D18
MQSRAWLNTDGQISSGKELFRRVTTRRRLVAGVLAAVVVVLIGMTVAWRTESANDRFVPAGSPRGLDAWRTESATDRSVPAGPSRGLDALASPIDLGWLPPGFHPPRAALIAPGTYGLQTERDDPSATLTVTMRNTEPTHETVEGTRTSVAVNGKSATVISVPPPPGDQEGVGVVRSAYRLLIVERKPGRWIQVRADTSSRDEVDVSVDDLRRIAEGLVDRPRPVADLVRFADLPDGLEPGTVTSDPSTGAAIGFVGPSDRLSVDPGWSGVITEDVGTRVWVGVGYIHVLGRSVGFTPGSPVRREIRIDGRRVWLVAGNPPGRPGAVVILDGNLGVAVSATGLTDEQLARFAAGIHPGPDL